MPRTRDPWSRNLPNKAQITESLYEESVWKRIASQDSSWLVKLLKLQSKSLHILCLQPKCPNMSSSTVLLSELRCGFQCCNPNPHTSSLPLSLFKVDKDQLILAAARHFHEAFSRSYFVLWRNGVQLGGLSSLFLIWKDSCKVVSVQDGDVDSSQSWLRFDPDFGFFELDRPVHVRFQLASF